jgi:DNA-binding NtrC family response regulator
LLDEIGDMDWNMQAKLLRVLQERTIRRVGGSEDIPVDVRILAATHSDLETAIANKHFREDLFFRLSVVTIRLPRLEHRPEDIPDLVRYFLQYYGAELGVHSPAIQPESVSFLQAQAWPGNVRQLENVLREALLLAHGYPISLENVQQIIAKQRKPSLISGQTHGAHIAELLAGAQRGEIDGVFAKLIEDLEPELYGQAIRLAEGNQAKAARWLGVTRLKMREKLIQFGLHTRKIEQC